MRKLTEHDTSRNARVLYAKSQINAANIASHRRGIRPNGFQRRRRVSKTSADLKAIGFRKHIFQPFQHQRMIICNENGYHTKKEVA
ncbi:hypothetical protein ACFQRK_21440 [Parapedobacter sp. GCM10030251]|uniref:hypothetical protein n=1 Tax=Parapedobacter sp. GCM10030251 TaxID=3273419 RepID=UPI00360E87D4